MGRNGHKHDRTSNLPRRRRIRPDDGWSVEAVSEVPLGPGMRAASLGEAMAAFQEFDNGLTWERAADLVVPLFQRVRPYPPGFPEPVRHILPIGISVTFGVDTGPAFVHVTADMLATWRQSLGQVAECGLRNLHRRAAAVDVGTVVRDSIADVPVLALQSGTGSASTFVLVPDELPRIFGRQARLFLSPMRDLLVGLPADVDLAFAAWLFGELAAPDPNCLAPLGFRFSDGRIAVEALDEPAAIA